MPTEFITAEYVMKPPENSCKIDANRFSGISYSRGAVLAANNILRNAVLSSKTQFVVKNATD